MAQNQRYDAYQSHRNVTISRNLSSLIMGMMTLAIKYWQAALRERYRRIQRIFWASKDFVPKCSVSNLDLYFLGFYHTARKLWIAITQKQIARQQERKEGLHSVMHVFRYLAEKNTLLQT